MLSIRAGSADLEEDLGNERRRATKPYKGGTVNLRVLISEGSPTARSIFTDMVKLVEDQSSAWYAADRLVTQKTDPGIPPTDEVVQSEKTDATGTMPIGAVYPVGMTPFCIMAAVYIVLVCGSRRDETEFDEGAELVLSREQAEERNDRLSRKSE